jgi:hypothetical protein
MIAFFISFFLIFGYGLIINHIRTGKITTNGTSWSLWFLSAIVGLITGTKAEFFSSFRYLLIFDALGCLPVILLSLKLHAFKFPDLWEIIMGMISVSALIIGTVFDHAIVGYTLNMITLTCSGIPIIVSTWNNKTNDPLDAWTSFYISIFLIAFAMLSEHPKPIEIINISSSVIFNGILWVGILKQWLNKMWVRQLGETL